jgi:hypothetical protein
MKSGIRYDKQGRLDRNLNIYLAPGTGHLGMLGTWARDTRHVLIVASRNPSMRKNNQQTCETGNRLARLT